MIIRLFIMFCPNDSDNNLQLPYFAEGSGYLSGQGS